MQRPHLLAVGAAHIDRRGQVTGPYVPAASNPGTMREEVGGGAFNAVRNAGRHGVTAALLSLRGGDLAAEAVARAIAESGVEDLSATFLDRTTPSYTAILDREGELVTGFADMGLYEFGFPKQVRRRKFRDALVPANAVLIDANLPQEAIERIVSLAGTRPVYAIAISPAKVVRLAGVLAALSCLFINGREARTLCGDDRANAREAAAKLREMGLVSAVISDGPRPAVAFDGQGFFTVEPPMTTAADVTGAGDALAGTIVAMLMRDMPLREAVRRGVAAAALTVASHSVFAEYGDDEFAAKLALVGEAKAVA